MPPEAAWERATEGPRLNVQAAGLEPGRVRSPAESRTNQATLTKLSPGLAITNACTCWVVILGHIYPRTITEHEWQV